MVESFALSLVWTYDVENDDFVVTLLQPATWTVECLLRTNLPDAAECITIHINETLTEGFEVEECVGWFLHTECSFVVTWDAVATETRISCEQRFVNLLLCLFVCVRNEVCTPVLQVGSKLISIKSDSQFYLSVDTLEVLDGTSEIDATHCFNKEFEVGTATH